MLFIFVRFIAQMLFIKFLIPSPSHYRALFAVEGFTFYLCFACGSLSIIKDVSL